MKQLKTFFLLNWNEKCLFFEALLFQYATWLLLMLLPFRTILKLYRNPQRPMTDPGNIVSGRIKAATARANLLAPWKNRCLVQSLAARCMLARRGIASSLHFGILPGAGQTPIAHAWLQVETFEVINKGPVIEEFNKPTTCN